MALPSALAFITGSSDSGKPANPTLTPEALARRQALASALIKEGSNYSPIQSPWQGVARVTDAISGAMQQHWADEDTANAMKAGAEQMASLYGGLFGGGQQAASSGAPVASAAPADASNGGTNGATGSEYTAGAGTGGSRSWRNNNPGNIEYGNFATANGATGSDGRFAIFPSYDAGRAAQSKLLFDSPNYRNLTLAQAINRWAPGSENNVPAYIAAMGADPGAVMGSFSPQQRAVLLDNMQRHEGWRPGTPFTVAGGAPTPAVAPAGVQTPQAPSNQVASADPNFVPQTPQTAPQQAIPLPPVDPRTQAAGQQQFAPNSLTGPQAEALANQGQTVPMSAVQNPPDTPDSAPAPQTGAQAVTNAMAAPSPVPQQAAAPNLSPQAQQVVQAMMPQQMQQPGLDMGKVSAIMANPWIPDSQKNMLNGIIMQRFAPHEMMPIQTGQGTMLIDKLTGQQRGFIPTANNQVIENQDGTRSIVNTNDPSAVAAYNKGTMGGGAGVNVFPGQPLTNEMKDYNAVAAQAKAAGQTPPTFQQYEYDLKKQGAQSVTIAGETAESKALGEARAANIVGYMKNGEDARQKFQTLQLIEDALKAGNGNISTGPGAEMILNAKQALGNVLGVNLDGVAPAEAVKKLGAQLASAASKGLTSRPTQFDFRTFLENNPGLDISPQGNNFLISIMKQQAQHEMDLSRMAQSYKGNTADWNDVVSQYDKEHPLISPFSGKPLGADEKLFPATQQQNAPQQSQNVPQSQGQTPPAATAPHAAIEFLRGDPSPAMRDYFDKKYGSGAAARALGEQQ